MQDFCERREEELGIKGRNLRLLSCRVQCRISLSDSVIQGLERPDSEAGGPTSLLQCQDSNLGVMHATTTRFTQTSAPPSIH
jgi:hypothetical protein